MSDPLKALLAVALLAACGATCAQPSELKVGSKRFTESYILGEIVAQTARRANEVNVVHKQGLGNTAILFAALQNGAIDIYPEYSGTIVQELLGGKTGSTLEEINRELAPLGVAAGVPLGFSNSYALALAETTAASMQIASISDLIKYPALRLGLSQEFLNRRDGWPALQRAYRLPFKPQGIDHGLAYEALATAQIDVMDVYTTDAKIQRYHLTVLQDDLRHFPRYDALLLYRNDLPQRLPQTWARLRGIEGSIPTERMIALNAAVELEGQSFADAAASYVNALQGGSRIVRESLLQRLFAEDFARLSVQHLSLVFVSLILSCAAGIPLGIWAARCDAARTIILPAVSVLQTIPSLALLAFLIALLNRIGALPAIAALFLYGLLPIVRNTATGLAEIPRGIHQASTALGLGGRTILCRIELPLAARTILAGVRTAAVINVGTATIAAFIGAGGFGERIVAGLAVNDHAMLLAGALPAAALAILIEWLFAASERWLIPRGLRLRARS